MCIPYVSRMYLDYLLRIHVCCMYPECIPHVSFISDTSISGCIWDTCISWCISGVSRMYLDHLCRYMYPECISNVSRMYLASQLRTSLDIFEVCVSDCIPHVSRPRYMYRDFVSRFILMYYKMYRDEESKIHVSWCILTCIQCDTKEAPKIHVSWCIWCVSQMYLGLVWDTCKIHAKCQDTCILLECNRACKIHLRYIRIHSGYMYPSGYMQDTCRIHKDTYCIGNHPQFV